MTVVASQAISRFVDITQKSSHGDPLCHVVVETPASLTARQKELLEEFESVSQDDAGTPKLDG